MKNQRVYEMILNSYKSRITAFTTFIIYIIVVGVVQVMDTRVNCFVGISTSHTVCVPGEQNSIEIKKPANFRVHPVSPPTCSGLGLVHACDTSSLQGNSWEASV